jgi:hypothetical protein
MGDGVGAYNTGNCMCVCKTAVVPGIGALNKCGTRLCRTRCVHVYSVCVSLCVCLAATYATASDLMFMRRRWQTRHQSGSPPGHGPTAAQ